MVALICGVISFFVFVDLVPAFKEKDVKYSILFLLSVTAVLTIWVLLYNGVKLSSPNQLINNILEGIVGPLK